MICAGCGFTADAGSVFCEACGATFPAAPAVLVASPPTLVLKAPGGCSCGAGSDKVDKDGVCGVCGTIIAPESLRDHIEIRLDASRAADSDKGHRHWRNEDFVSMASEIIDGFPATVFVVSDGVSSSENPDQASEAACKAALDAVLEGLRAEKPDPQAAVRQAIVSAQNAVLKVEYPPSSKKEPPEATLLIALVHRGTATIGWLGDTRAYAATRSSAGAEAVLLTEDHSWVNDVVKAGLMSLEEALKDKRAHAITQSLGQLTEGDCLAPSIKSLSLDGFSYLIGCTDGFWNYGHPSQDQPPQALIDLLATLPADPEALSVAQTCVNYANQQGGQDNITVAVLAL